MTVARRLVACLIVLCAFVLRMADLERRPLHFDEGNNVYFGQLDAAGLLRDSIGTIDTDPPGHRFALGTWMPLNGRSPFSIRYFSVWFATLACAALFTLARWLKLGTGRSAMAGLLLAGLAYSMDNGQQAKGYAMGLGCGVLSWLLWIDLTRTRPDRNRMMRAAAYAGCAGLALSTHFFAAALLPMHWLWLLIVERGRVRAVLRRWPLLLPQVIACVPVGAWSALTFGAVVRGTEVASADVAHAPLHIVLLRIFGEFALSQFAPSETALLAAGAVCLGLCALGTIAAWRAGLRAAAAFVIALAIPIAGAVLVSQRVTFFFPRFLLFALPAVCVALAVLARGRVGKVLLAAALIPGLVAFSRAPIDAEDDYRALVAELRARARPGDAALATYIWTEGIVESYAPELRGRLTWYRDVYNAESVDQGLMPIVRAHDRVWSFNFRRDPYAPDSASAYWLRARRALAGVIGRRDGSSGTSSMRTLLFVNPAPGAAETTQHFDNGVTVSARSEAVNLDAGDVLSFRLLWRAEAALDPDVAMFVHVLDAQGALVAQSEGDAVNGLAPAFTWAPGLEIDDARAVLMPLSARGTFSVVAGMYSRASGVRVPIAGADAARLFTVRIR
jgi:hypothetical protein